MKHNFRLISCSFLFLFVLTANAQLIKLKPYEAKQGVLMSIQYGVHVPGKDLADRFGWNSSVGVDAVFKTEKGWLLGGNYRWMFGNRVKELNMFDSILGESGEIIDSDGLFSEVRLNERAHLLQFSVGKIIPLSKKNKNSGIMIKLSGGAFYHRIDIYAPTAKVPHLTGDYEKGYDRLNGGPAFSQYIGYQHLDPKNRVNFNIGFSATQAFTKSLRTHDYLLKKYDNTERRDNLSGLIIGVTVPIFTKKKSTEIFFED